VTESAARSRPIPSGEPMCEQCDKFQEQILHYCGFLQQRFDPLTERRIKELIADLEQRKATMHSVGPA
jgi:hypothetical protein